MKTITLFLSLFLSVSLSAQLNSKDDKNQKNTKETILLEEGFEGSTDLPEGWALVDADGDGFNWEVKSDTVWHIPHSGYNTIVSESFNNGALDPENYLITPAIDLSDGSNFFVSWWVMSYDQLDFADETYKVLVSTTGTDPADFTNVVFEETMTVTGEYENRTADISSFAGETVYVAFVHFDSYDRFKLMLDDVTVFKAFDIDAEMTKITTLPFGNTTEQIDISGTVTNMGVNTITSFDVVYTIDDGTESSVFSVSGISLLIGEAHNFIHDVPYQFTADGNYDINVEIKNVNSGDDQDINNNTKTQSIDINANYVERIILHEEFTSSTCQPCIFANMYIDKVLGDPYNQGKFTLIKHQCNFPGLGDPYYNLDVATRQFYYDVNSIPELLIDASSESVSYQQYMFESYRVVPSFFSIDVVHEITGDNIEIKVTIEPNMDFAGSCHIAVVEKTTIGNISTNGETEFHNVLMKMLPNAYGISVDLTQGTNYTYVESYDMSSTFVEEMDDLAVIVFLQAIDKEVMQSANSTLGVVGIGSKPNNNIVAVFPNPTSGIVHFSNVKKSQITVYNILGKIVANNILSAKGSIDLSNQPNGTYMISIETGNSIVTKKMIINR